MIQIKSPDSGNTNKQTVVLAGGSGFLGNILIDNLHQQYHFIVLCRNPEAIKQNINAAYFKWDAKSVGNWQTLLEDAKAVINLCGRSVDCRYNEKNKKEILESRIDSTLAIGNAIKMCKQPPELWINSASATIYKHVTEMDMDEYCKDFANGFSIDVCNQWEAAFNNFEISGVRKVVMRISLVMGKSGGVFPVLKRLTKFGLGGRMGNGKQFVSWIHELDFASAISFIISNNKLYGVYNLASPNPLLNKALMQQFRTQCNIPFGLPASNMMLEVGAFILRTETELILESRRVVSKRLAKAGFKFQFEYFADALQHLSS